MHLGSSPSSTAASTAASYKPQYINLSIETVCPVKGEAWVLDVGIKGRRIRANPSQSSSTTEALFFKSVNLKFPFVSTGEIEFKLSRNGHIAQGIFDLETLANTTTCKVIQRKTQLAWVGGGIGLGPAPVVDFRIALDPPPPTSLAESVWQVPTPMNLHTEKPDNLLFVTDDKPRQLNVASLWGAMVDESIIGAPPPARKRNSTTTNDNSNNMTPTHSQAKGEHNDQRIHDEVLPYGHRLRRPSTNHHVSGGGSSRHGSARRVSVRVPTLGDEADSRDRRRFSEIEQNNPVVGYEYRRVDRNVDEIPSSRDHSFSRTSHQRSSDRPGPELSPPSRQKLNSSTNSSSGSSCRRSSIIDNCPVCSKHSSNGHIEPYHNNTTSTSSSSGHGDTHFSGHHHCGDHSHHRCRTTGKNCCCGEKENQNHTGYSSHHRHGGGDDDNVHCRVHSRSRDSFYEHDRVRPTSANSGNVHSSNSRMSRCQYPHGSRSCGCEQQQCGKGTNGGDSHQHTDRQHHSQRPHSSTARRDSSYGGGGGGNHHTSPSNHTGTVAGSMHRHHAAEELRNVHHRDYSDAGLNKTTTTTSPHSTDGSFQCEKSIDTANDNVSNPKNSEEHGQARYYHAHNTAGSSQRYSSTKKEYDDDDGNCSSGVSVDPRLPPNLVHAVATRRHYH